MSNRAEDLPIITIKVVSINKHEATIVYHMAKDSQKRRHTFQAMDGRSRDTVRSMIVGDSYTIEQFVMPRGTGWAKAIPFIDGMPQRVKFCPIKAAVSKQQAEKQAQKNLVEMLFGFD